jgi:hypothetical protein
MAMATGVGGAIAWVHANVVHTVTRPSPGRASAGFPTLPRAVSFGLSLRLVEALSCVTSVTVPTQPDKRPEAAALRWSPSS